MDVDSIEMERYIEAHIDQEWSVLHNIYRRSHLELIGGRMASGHLQGTILKMFTRMINPQNVLEIGTFTGYSAISIASGFMRLGAMLHTIEIDDELELFIRRSIAEAHYEDRITLHIGDATDVIPTLDCMFDMAFIDGNKRNYISDYELVMQRLNVGGYVIADNVLWDGHVLTTPASNDKQTQGVIAFNDYVCSDSRVERVIIPVRDGLTIIRKMKN